MGYGFERTPQLPGLQWPGSESSQWEEVSFFIKYLAEQGWIAVNSGGGKWARVTVTIKGYSHIADVAVSRDLSQAFVVMWFSDEMKEPYERGIRPAIEHLGYDAFNIASKPDVDKIDDEIIGEIRRSHFLVADFTHGSNGARGGIYLRGRVRLRSRTPCNPLLPQGHHRP